MGFLFKSKKKDKIFAIFDIGSGSVGGAIVKMPFSKDGVPVIIKSVRTDIKYHKDFDFNMFMKEMISTLDSTAHSLYDKKAGAPKEIFCVLASPWYVSETRIIKYTQKKPLTFTSHLAGKLIEKEILDLTQLYKNKYGDLNSAPKIIEQHTMAVSLNGHVTEDPLSKKCQSLEMNMIISLAPKLCLDAINETLSKIFHHINVTFSSFTVDTYLAVRDKYITLDSYLLLDISGEITDVGIVRNGVLKSVLSFPFGKKNFFKYISTMLKIELRDAKELFKLYSDDNLSTEYKKKVIPLFKSLENSWGEAFSQCINILPRPPILPSTIFLTADNDIKDWFTNVLQNEKHIQTISFNNKCNVLTLNGTEFLNMCDVEEGVCDPFLMIEAIAIMRKMNK